MKVNLTKNWKRLDKIVQSFFAFIDIFFGKKLDKIVRKV